MFSSLIKDKCCNDPAGWSTRQSKNKKRNKLGSADEIAGGLLCKNGSAVPPNETTTPSNSPSAVLHLKKHVLGVAVR